jgi:hypothetical protein
MTLSTAQLSANCANARLSSGPVTQEGKAVVAQNAVKHGLLASRPVLAHEDPDAYHLLVADLVNELHPVGVLEHDLVERIALALWRQRRLVHAERAQLQLQLDNRQVATQVSHALKGPYDGASVRESDLEPVDKDNLEWYQRALSELKTLDHKVLTNGWRQLETEAPLIYEDLINSAQEEDQPVGEYLTGWGGLNKYLTHLKDWCRKEIYKAEQRPRILELASLVRDERSILLCEQRDRMAKYQVMLDNQLSKAIKTLQETQKWRLATLVAVNDENGFISPMP